MKFEGWYLLLGVLMLAVASLDRFFKRLPITTTILYLAVGVALGPLGFGITSVDPIKWSPFLERITEIAVIVSLFTTGLKLRASLTDLRWRMPFRLAFISMALTVALIAGFAIVFLKLPVGAAILLGAILAPTDPVLASDVQLEHAKDPDRVRFSLTGEAGLNDGTAFPFVMLGLGLLGAHEIGEAGWRWLAVDLLWAVSGGLAIGAGLGTAFGKFVVYLRRKHEETRGRDEFISLGLIGTSYGAALFLHTYGFLAVFAAGLAFRHIELHSSKELKPSSEADGTQDSPDTEPAAVASAVLNANEELERILEIGVVLLLGAMLDSDYLRVEALWLALVLFLLFRPAAVTIGTICSDVTPLQRTLYGWFGIRGIGSLYYLMYALQYNLHQQLAQTLVSLVLGVVIISIFAHGFSVTPIMRRYEDRKLRIAR